MRYEQTCRGGLNLKDYLLDIMQKQEHGLYLCELPTGNGKTFDSAQAMKVFADSVKDNTKIIYLTTLNKNLPEEALMAAYGSEELYKRNVLRLRSNFDEVVEKILEIDVPEDMKTDAYFKLCKDVSLYRNAVDKRYSDKEYIKELADRITEGDRQLRYEITKLLKRKFSNKSQRKKAIRNDSKYKWIGKLYPAVFTDDYKIILMSVSKFMKRNSILIDSSYEFLNSDLIENAIIVIDEFDATKDTIQGELIEKSLAMQEDYIQLFRQIYRTLNPNDFSSGMRQAMEEVAKSGSRNTFSTLMDEARKIAEYYHVRLSIKTKEELVDQRQIFLFNDGSFHTVLKEGTQYIRSTLNEEDNRIDVFFEGKEEFFKNRNKEKDIVLYSLLREINVFLLHFRLFSIEWAKNYMDIINSARDGIVDAMNLENAISTILKRLELTNKQRDMLMGETCQMIRNKRELILEDRSFYQVGMEYYEFEDNDSHHDNTNLKFVKVYDTPEKIMLYLAGKATVFGISATAEVDTVIGNYDLRYLKEQLRDKFHNTPSYLKEKTRVALEERWKCYTDGAISVHGEVISSSIQGFHAEDYCKTFMDVEFARYSANVITNMTDNEYQIIRYCNVLKAMCIFNRDEDIQSMLYLGMALPKKNNPDMDEGVLQQLFEYAQLTTGQKGGSVCFLKGDNFDQDKKELQQRLSCGEKIFVMSSYQTIGAGQNLQYRIPKGRKIVQLGEPTEDDKRFLYKDFDALYLGNITNMTVNTYQDERITSHDLLQMLFQIEELYENGELNYYEKDQMLKLAFRSYTGSEQFAVNMLYKQKSVIAQASRMVLQAVGRMCRTFVKNPNIYLFVESELLDKIYVGELKKRILPPEMKVIVDMREKLGKNYLPEENIILNKAEKISSVGLWTIRRMLSKDWTEENMQLWELLRELVLQFPTASVYDWQNNEYLQKLYITSGEKRNQYIYSQYSDFNDVTIDFGNDKVAFKNSKRAKIKGNSDEFAIYEMSEKESGLQAILRYPGMRAYFEAMGYALRFEINEYLLSPVLFHNIYKGALGEVAGKFILNKELGIELSPITEPDYFEFFDYKLSEDVYVDFKNWKFTYVQERDEIRKDILRKLEAIGGKRVYIINIVSDNNYKPSTIVDQRLVEIPMLIKEDGTVCYENLHMIHKEDFENVN